MEPMNTTGKKAKADINKLFDAIVKGDLSVVKELVENGRVDPNCLYTRDKIPNSALYMAVRYGHEDLVKYLIGKQADLNKTNHVGLGPIHEAAIKGNLGMFKLLVKNGANFKASTQHSTPLHCAALEGHLDICKYLIQTLKVDPNIRNFRGDTPLMYAAIKGDLDFFKMLIELGADWKLLGEDNKSPLHCAFIGGHVSIVRYLMDDLQLNPYECDMPQGNLLHWSLKSFSFTSGHQDHWSVPDLETKPDDAENPIGKGLFEIIKYLVEERNFHVNKGDKDGSNAVLLACQWSNLDVVKYLANRGGNFEAFNFDHNTALHLAAVGGKVEIIPYLIDEKKCDVNRKNKMGEIPLMTACRIGNLDCVQLLVQNGSNCDAVMKGGEGCLDIACAYGHSHVVKYLIKEKGFDVNKRSRTKLTPLHVACAKGHLETVKVLLEAGADPNAVDRNNKCCLHFAGKLGHSEIVRFLLDKKVVDTDRLLDKNDPLDLAIANNQVEHFKVLYQMSNCVIS